jgi:hypothetical protein
MIATPSNMEKEAAPAPAELPSWPDVARPINIEKGASIEPELPLTVVARALINLERASVEHELPSEPDFARPINMEKALVLVESDLPLSVVARVLINMETASVLARAPNSASSPSPPPSPCATSHDTCDCEDDLEEKNQSTKVLVAMCIGLLNDQKQRIIDIAQEPWISMKNQNKIKPLNPDFCNEVVRRWETYLAPVAGDKTGPRPKSWKTPTLMEWLNQNPVKEFYDVEWTIGRGRYLC